MSLDTNVTREETATDNSTLSDKEFNFRKQEQMYKRMLEEKEARINELQQSYKSASIIEDDDSDDEPYVDRRKLKKALSQFEQKNKKETQSDIQSAVSQALYEERKQNWVKNNPDFTEVMKHAQKLADRDPELAEAILDMPDTFERQKLVYKNIKAFGFHKPDEPKETIQNKIDRNRRTPYYQPTGISNAPYESHGDFSPTGQKNAYEKMKELKNRLRLG